MLGAFSLGSDFNLYHICPIHNASEGVKYYVSLRMTLDSVRSKLTQLLSGNHQQTVVRVGHSFCPCSP